VGRYAGRAIAWAEELSREVIRRQRADGSWSNRSGASKEDDPLVATTLAVGALGACLMAGLSSRGGGA
jgi:hypothetical protein